MATLPYTAELLPAVLCLVPSDVAYFLLNMTVLHQTGRFCRLTWPAVHLPYTVGLGVLPYIIDGSEIKWCRSPSNQAGTRGVPTSMHPWWTGTLAWVIDDSY